MIKGSPHDDTRFYEVVERCGGLVVADDHTCGERMFDGGVREADDLLDAIAFYYQTQSFSRAPIRSPIRTRVSSPMSRRRRSMP